MARSEELTDAQWAVIAPLFPKPPRATPRGRPRRPDREVLNGVLWILRTGARWQDLPPRFPPYQTCHRRFQQWARDGTLKQVLEALAEHLRATGQIDLRECFIDGTFVPAKKGALPWVPQSGAKVRRSWQWQTALVFLSPSTQRLLRRMKSLLLKRPSRTASPGSGPSG